MKYFTKRAQLLCMLSVFLTSLSIAQNVEIPDANFKSYLVNNFEININGDDEIQVSEAAIFSGEINIQYQYINDLTGIEAFVNLTTLRADGYNNFDSLDLTNNTELVDVRCSRNDNLTYLNISQCAKLQQLHCSNTSLNTVDVSGNPNLQILKLNDGVVTNLDVSINLNLLELHVRNNQITELVVNNNTALQTLVCYGNNFNTLDFRGLTNLSSLNATQNPQLLCINVDSVELAQEYVSYYMWSIDNQAVFNTDCEANFFYPEFNLPTAVELNTTFNISDQSMGNAESYLWNFGDGNTSSTMGDVSHSYVDSTGSYIITLTQSKTGQSNLSTSHEILVVKDINAIVEIPDANFKSYLVNNVEINTNGDDEIQVYEAGLFTGEINIEYGNVSDLTGIEAFINITSLDTYNNRNLSILNLSNNKKLEYINCYYNQNLVYIDVTQCSKLQRLVCSITAITSIDLSANPELNTFYASSSDLLALNLSQNPKIYDLQLNNSEIITLDLRNGNNNAINYISASNTPNLRCVNVDTVEVAENMNWYFDDRIVYSTDCESALVANFTSDTHMGNSPLTVSFEDLSYGQYKQWSWDVDGDGAEDYNTQNPSHTYTEEGNYNVSLTIRDKNGNENTKTMIGFVSIVPESNNEISISYTQTPPTIDGDISEWANVPSNPIVQIYGEGNAHEEIVSMADSFPTFKAMWDDENIYILVEVPDDDFYPSTESGMAPYLSDKPELYFDVVVDQYGMDGGSPANLAYGHHQIAPDLEGYESDSIYAYSYYGLEQNVASSYAVEYKIPFTRISVDNFASYTGTPINPNTTPYIGFDINIIDLDEPGKGLTTAERQRISWSNPVPESNANESWSNLDYAGKLYFDMESNPNPSLVANFKSDKQVGLAPLTVKFSDMSTGSPVAWSWDVDGDSIEDYAIQNPEHIYTEEGLYNVRLIVANAAGVIDTLVQEGFVDIIIPNFSDTEIEILKTNNPPIIDGDISEWNKIPSHSIAQIYGQGYDNEEHVSMQNYKNPSFKATWDDENIYILVEVPDDDFYPNTESGLATYLSDKPELYFDVIVDKYGMDGGSPAHSAYGHHQIAPDLEGNEYDSEYAYSYYGLEQSAASAYAIEYKIPFTNIPVDNSEGFTGTPINPNTTHFIGFDINIIDLDEFGKGITTTERQRITWSNPVPESNANESWSNLDYSGKLYFTERNQIQFALSNGTNGIEGINIFINNENVGSTDSLGYFTYEIDANSESLNYELNAEGYYAQTGIIHNPSGTIDIERIVVSKTATSYPVKFNIVDMDNQPLAGAYLALDRYGDYYADSNGVVNISHVLSGMVNYTISMVGYMEKHETLNVTSAIDDEFILIDRYTLTDNDVYIDNGVIKACYYNFALKKIIIPDSLQGQKIIAIDNDANFYTNGIFQNRWLKSVKLPKGLERIGESTFAYNQLESIDFSNCSNLVSISDKAFYSNLLSNIDLSANTKLALIDYQAFNQNSASLTLPTPNYEGFVNWMDNYENTHEGGSTLNREELSYNIFYANIEGNYTLSNSDVTVINGEIVALNTPLLKKDIVIPNNLQGQTIVGIGHDVFSQQFLKSVALPDSLIYINFAAFYNNNISSIDLTNCSLLQRIENYAFESNRAQSIDLSQCTRLHYIGAGNFNFEFILPQPNAEGFQYWLDENGKSIDANTSVANNDSPYRALIYYTLTDDDVEVNDGMISFCSYNFEYTDIIVPTELHGQEITTIGDYVFYAKNITTIKLPSTLISIGNYALSNNQLALVNFSELNALEYMGVGAFIDNRLSQVDLSNSSALTEIAEQLFSYNRIKKVSLPPYITSINQEAFYYNQIDSIDLSKHELLNHIGTYAYAHNNSTFIKINENNNITSIEYAAFIGNRVDKLQLPNPVAPSNFQYIWTNGYETFLPGSLVNELYNSYEATLKLAYTVSVNVTNINGEPVSGANVSLGIYNAQATNALGSTLFPQIMPGASLEYTVTTPSGFTTKGTVHVIDQNIDIAITATENNPAYVIEDGYIISYNGAGGDLFVPEIIMGDTIIGISSLAFENANLTSISLPGTLLQIDNGAFANNQMAGIDLPFSFLDSMLMWKDWENNMYAPGTMAYNLMTEYRLAIPYVLTNDDVEVENGSIISCSYSFEYTDIIIPDTLDGQNIVAIDVYVFNSKGITSLTLPTGLQKIGRDSFWGNYIGEINLGLCPNLQIIGPGAFNGNRIKYLDLSANHELLLIGGWAFSRNGLTGVNFTGCEKLNIIGTSAFSENANLNDFDLSPCTSLSFIAYQNNIDYTLPALAYDGFSGWVNNNMETIEANTTVSSQLAYYTATPKQYYTLGNEDVLINSGVLTLLNNELPYANIIIPDYLHGELITSIEYFGTNYDARIVLPSGIETIQEGAFFGNQNYDAQLLSVDFSKSKNLKTIENNAFAQNLIDQIDLTICSDLEVVGAYAFENNKLNTIDLTQNNKLLSIGSGAFSNNYIENFILPSNTTYADLEWKDSDQNAYAAGDTVAELYTQYYVPAIYTLNNDDVVAVNGIIESCSYNFAIKDIIVPAKLDDQDILGLGANVFLNKGIVKIDLSACEKLSSFSSSCLQGNNLRNIDFKTFADLEYIGTTAFYNNQLDTINLSFNNKLILIDESAFSENYTTEFALPKNETYENLTWMNFNGDTLNAGAVIKDMNTMYYIPATYILTDNDVVVNNGIIESCSYNFALKQIMIPEKLDKQIVTGIAATTYRQDILFGNHNIVSVELPATLEYIGDYAFAYNALKQINIAELANLESIGEGAFYNNRKYNTHIVKPIDLTNCESLTSIDRAAFDGWAGIDFITLPKPNLNGFYFDGWRSEYGNIYNGGSSTYNLWTSYSAVLDPYYELVLEVSDGFDPIANAEIFYNSINSLKTDSIGRATLSPIDSNMVLAYSVHALGYCSISDTIALANENMLVKITLSPLNEEKSISLCANELPYVFGEHVLPIGMESKDTILYTTTAMECNSELLLHVNMLPAYDTSFAKLVLCSDSLPYNYHGHILPLGQQSGDTVLVLNSAMGCDSIVSLSMTIYEPVYTLTVHIMDDSVGIAFANVLFNGQDFITDKNGTLLIDSIENGGYNYQINVQGYEYMGGILYINDNNMVKTVELTPQALPVYEIDFLVLNDSIPVANAIIKTDSYEYVTDSLGKIKILNVPTGTYSYQVDKHGFSSYPGIVKVDNSSLFIKVELEKTVAPVFVAEIKIQHDAMPIIGAKLSANGKDYFSNTEGIVKMHNLVAGKYAYNITSQGFENAEGEFTIDTSNIAEQVNLTQIEHPVYAVTLQVKYKDKALSNIKVVYDSITYVSNPNGIVTIYNNKPGTYHYTISNSNYNLVNDSVMVYNKAINRVVELEKIVIPTYLASINVTDGSNAIKNALVSFNNKEYQSDVNGNVMLDSVTRGNYPYQILAQGYEKHDGTIIVDTTQVIEKVTLIKNATTAYSLNIKVVNDSIGIAKAKVQINNTEVFTNDQGELSILNLAPALYDYTIIAQGFENNVGQITISDSNVMHSIQMTPIVETRYTVSMLVHDGEHAILGAMVTFDSLPYTSDAEGGVSILNLSSGTYNYKISAHGFEDKMGSVTVDSLNVFKSIALVKKTQPVYTFNINITDGQLPINGAMVLFDSVNYISNYMGQVSIVNLLAGNYNYQVSAAGFITADQSITIADTNVIAQVNLDPIPTEYLVQFNVSSENQLLSGAKVSIDNIDILELTDQNGLVDTSLVTGTYSYQVTLEGYEPFAGIAEVKADTIIQINLVKEPTLFSVTFSINDGSSNITNAAITFNGILYEKGDYQINDIEAGDYSYSIVADGYKTYKANVKVIDKNVAVRVTLEKTVGINDLENPIVNCYPIPANNFLTLSLTNSTDNVQILNTIGQLVYENKLENNETEIKIDVSNLKSGVYVVKARSKNQYFTRNIVIE